MYPKHTKESEFAIIIQIEKLQSLVQKGLNGIPLDENTKRQKKKEWYDLERELAKIQRTSDKEIYRLSDIKRFKAKYKIRNQNNPNESDRRKFVFFEYAQNNWNQLNLSGFVRVKNIHIFMWHEYREDWVFQINNPQVKYKEFITELNRELRYRISSTKNHPTSWIRDLIQFFADPPVNQRHKPTNSLKQLISASKYELMIREKCLHKWARENKYGLTKELADYRIKIFEKIVVELQKESPVETGSLFGN